MQHSLKRRPTFLGHLQLPGTARIVASERLVLGRMGTVKTRLILALSVISSLSYHTWALSQFGVLWYRINADAV